MDSSSDGSERPRWFVHFADFANMLKAFIGSNYLSIAFAFHQSGLIMGIVGLLFIAGLTDHCCHLIVKCKYKAISHIIQSQPESDPVTTNRNDSVIIENDYIGELRKNMLRNLSYGDIGKISFGKGGIYVVNFCLFLTQFGFCIAYFIFIGNTIRELFPLELCDVQNGTKICHPYKSTAHKEAIHISQYSTENSFPVMNDSVIHNNTNSFMESSMSTYYKPSMDDDESGSENVEISKLVNNVTANMTDIYSIQSTAPSLKLLVLVPLPVFITFSYVRNVRNLGGISVGANLSIFVGAVAVMIYLILDFHISESFKYLNLAELPMFFGLVTGAFEGIGTIIPIESSMEGNRHNFSAFLHGAVGCLATILLSFGILGYLKFGEQTNQMINVNIKSSSPLNVGIAVNICLCIGVILTFPLQMFPVVELAENFIFADGRICGPKKRHLMVGADDEGEGYSDRDSLLSPGEVRTSSHVPVATVISTEVSTLKRNVLRMFIVSVAAGLAVLFRDKFAYIGAFTGSIGSSLLAYILPCMFYLKLGWSDMPWYYKVKNIAIIIIGVICSIISLYASVKSLVSSRA